MSSARDCAGAQMLSMPAASKRSALSHRRAVPGVSCPVAGTVPAVSGKSSFARHGWLSRADTPPSPAGSGRMTSDLLCRHNAANPAVGHRPQSLGDQHLDDRLCSA
jgi:hypothetical protein